jgi:uncharacterized protein (DUF58 family)
MRITLFGWKGVVFYAMLICAFFAAPYLNLFFMLLAFCSVLAVLNVWWAYRNITQITGRLEDIAPMPAGASQMAKATLRCGARTRHCLAVQIHMAGATTTVLGHADLRPGPDQRVDVMMPPLPRGVHGLDRVRVSSQFPFGIVETRRELEGPETITVYPAPADLARYRDRSEGAGRGLGGPVAAEMGPAGLREFRDGDELRNVHWKATARRGELVVRELEGDAAPGMEVLLDLRVQSERFEEALSLISGLALECKENKELFTLHTQKHRGTYGKGHESFDKLLRHLAELRPLPDTCPPPPAVSPTVLRLPLANSLVPVNAAGEPTPC